MSITNAGCAFDQHGNVLWADDGRGRTVYAYDAAGRLTTSVYPDGSCLGLRYDDRGNVIERQTPSGGRERFRYDPAGQLLDTDYPDGSAAAYRYDQHGHPLAVDVPGCATRYSYDDAGRPVRCEQTIAGATYTTELQFGEQSQLLGARISGWQHRLCFRYDDQQRLVALGYDDVPELVRIEYQAAERQALISYANGVVQRFAFDEHYQIAQITAQKSTDTPLLDLCYRTGSLGAITAINERRFHYDQRGRLAAYGTLRAQTRYQYDDAGNRLTTQLPSGTTCTYDYDNAGRLCRWTRPNGAVVHNRYDGGGSLIARTDERGTWSYRYDGAGHLIQALRRREPVAAYGYDHTGRRVLKRTATEMIITHRDPWGNRIAERRSDGELRLYLGPAGQPLVCLVVRDEQLTTLFLHPDHLGSVRAVTDEAGALVARYDFDPFGNREGSAVVEHPAAALCGARLQIFAGHPYDADLRLYDAGVRLYDPEIGRFITEDSYTFSADDPRLLWLPTTIENRRQVREQRLRAWQRERAHRNRYVYALNNPLLYVDRDGHSAGLYILYTLTALFWALPYTLVGFLFFEVWLNWITFAWLWDMSDHSWSGESSDRLGAWAWWTIGGLSGKLVIGGGGFTLGNFVIGNADFMQSLNDTNRTFGIPLNHNELTATPLDTNTLLTQRGAVVEHELRHTNQYGWWGPFMMPWLLVLYFLFQNLVNTGFSKLIKTDVHIEWGKLWQLLTDKWWNTAIAGVGVLLLPGAYWWDYIFRGGYANSWFEQNAALHSGAANGQDVQATASKDRVAPSGTSIISVISRPSRVGSLTLRVTTSGSGAPTLVDITPAQITNLRVFQYTAGANNGTDVLTAGDGSSTATLEIRVQ